VTLFDIHFGALKRLWILCFGKFYFSFLTLTSLMINLTEFMMQGGLITA